jgi:broad specificity phosphatase PhoE
MAVRTKEELEKEIAECGRIQSTNPYSSKAWQDASKRLHKAIEELTGKPAKEAWGR